MTKWEFAEDLEAIAEAIGVEHGNGAYVIGIRANLLDQAAKLKLEAASSQWEVDPCAV